MEGKFPLGLHPLLGFWIGTQKAFSPYPDGESALLDTVLSSASQADSVSNFPVKQGVHRGTICQYVGPGPFYAQLEALEC